MYNPDYPNNPATAPAPPPPPPPQEAEEPAPAPRYPYLVTRLRNRQITMEEATELFSIQRQQVRTLMARTNALTAAASVPALGLRAPRPTAPSTTAAPINLDSFDPWGEGLLFLALGAGLLAALLKRAQGEAPVPAKTRPTPPPGARQS